MTPVVLDYLIWLLGVLFAGFISGAIIGIDYPYVALGTVLLAFIGWVWLMIKLYTQGRE